MMDDRIMKDGNNGWKTLGMHRDANHKVQDGPCLSATGFDGASDNNPFHDLRPCAAVIQDFPCAQPWEASQIPPLLNHNNTTLMIDDNGTDLSKVFDDEEDIGLMDTADQDKEEILAPLPSFNSLPDEVIAHAASFLNVGSLKVARLVNSRFNRILSQDEAGWVDHCHRLWNRKVHVSMAAKQALASGSTTAMEAYQSSCRDARLRHIITREELIYDPNRPRRGTIWSFRFKGTAGTEWTNLDPWHSGGEARRMVFLANGTVRQVNGDPNDPSATLEMVNPFSGSSAQQPGTDIQWRFVAQPLDLPPRREGAYIRLTISGREVPTYVVHRSPTGNWGWAIENCWGVFASFALPRKSATATTAPSSTVAARTAPNHAAGSHVGAAPPRQPRMRLRRFSNGADPRWLDMNGLETDSEEDGESGSESTSNNNSATIPTNGGRPSKRRKVSNDLLDDESLSVTHRWQWREALLYNLGVATFPEGPESPVELDMNSLLTMTQRIGSLVGVPGGNRTTNQVN